MENSLPLSDDVAGPIGLVNLPNLQYLCLSSSRNHKEVANILSLIIVPPTATLKFCMENRRLGEILQVEECEIILDKLASSFSTFFCHRGTDLPYRNLEVSLPDGGNRLRLRTRKDVRRISTTPDLELSIAIYLHPLSSQNSAQNVLRRTFPSLPLSNVTTLTLDIYPALGFLEGALDQLSRLQEVKVGRGCTAEFIQALKHKPENYNDEPSAYYSVSFPALQSLWIHSCWFAEDGCTAENLQDCLMERCERRADLLKLKLTSCYRLRDDDVARLREIVCDVEWDGRK
jgi:hypothetical protein